MNARSIIQQLELKSLGASRVRMPSIVLIHELLLELGIEHSFFPRTNTVEYSSKGATFVYSRHKGRTGYVIQIDAATEEERAILGTYRFEMDASDSYYTRNTQRYATVLLDFIEHEKSGCRVIEEKET